MKKLVSIILTVVMLLAIVPLGAVTVTAAISGITGDCTWKLDGTVLTISGKGDMGDYLHDFTPWRDMNITEVIIEDGVKSIGEGAFKTLTLKTITIPESVVSVGHSAFAVCEVQRVNIKNIAAWCNIYYDGINSHPFNLGDGKLYLNGELISELIIPKDVIKISHFAFSGCYSIKKVTIPDSVTHIDNYVFSDCINLENIKISNSITSIGEGAFSGCKSLKGVIIPENVTSIGDYAFSGCESITNITIPENIKVIGSWAFGDCSKLEKVNFNAVNCTSMHSYNMDMGYMSAFECCYNLKTVNIGEKVTNIPEYAFVSSIIENVTIPKSVVRINNSAFEGCKNLKQIWYGGYIKDKENISIGSNNKSLTNAKWYYKNCSKHTYINECDKECNVCGAKRTVKHAYSNSCDTKCNVCGDKRSIKHSYKTVSVIKKATQSKSGKQNVKCSVCGKKTTETIKKIKSIKLSKASYTYNDKTVKPSVTVKDSNGKTVSSKYYTVSYASGRKKVGKYKVTIKFKGNYSGSKTLYFKINPKKTSVSKVTDAKKSLKVTIKKQSKQVTGYQIQYSTSKKFKSAKTKTIKSYKTTSVTLKSLKAKKTYYVRVRTYKTVKGKKYYSAWSSAKSKKTK